MMKDPIKFVSFICDPLKRLIRHYNFSNFYNSMYDFNRYYLRFGDNDSIGWTGTRERTNNYFSYYLVFRNKEEITEETVKKRFYAVFVEEKSIESQKLIYTLISKEKGCKKHVQNEEESYYVREDVMTKFKKNNILDYLLYDICSKFLEYS